MSERQAEAAAVLARLGIDAEAVAAGAVPAERLAGPEAAALVAALGELGDAPVAALLGTRLGALEAGAETRAIRRELRRALYRLRQRGVAVPAPAPAEPTPAHAPAAVTAEGFVSHHSGQGDRILWIVRALADGPLLIAAQANEPGGLTEVRAVDTTRKRLRAARQRLEHEVGFRLVPADWRTVDALLVEAHERGGGAERTRDYLRLRPRLTSEPPRPPAEPVSSHAPPPGAEEAAALAAASAAVLEQPELRTWFPAPEAIAPFAEEIAGMGESPLIVSRAASEDRHTEILRRAATTLFPPAVLARRLEGTAYVLAETGRGAPARQALGAAQLLRQHPERATDVPLVVALVARALRPLLTESKEERQGSLVVTPAQFLRDRASARPGRTRG